MDPRGDATLDAGQAEALAALADRCADGDEVAGWKLGMTSGRSRDAFGPGIRPFGFILASRVFNSGAAIPLFDGAGVENELCWELAEPLSGVAVSAAQARGAVAGVAPAFELNQLRLGAEAGPAERIADNLSQWGLVVGPTVPAPDDLDVLEVVLRCDGNEQQRVAARGHIDDHYETLARLARELARFGRGLEAGDRVISGAYTRCRVDRPSSWLGDFGPEIGTVEIAFS